VSALAIVVGCVVGIAATLGALFGLMYRAAREEIA